MGKEEINHYIQQTCTHTHRALSVESAAPWPLGVLDVIGANVGEGYGIDGVSAMDSHTG
jgi:hypothetical protein